MSGKQSFFILVCFDSHLLRNKLDLILQQTSEKKDVYTFWGDDGLDEGFWNKMVLQDLFSNLKILIIRNAQLLPSPIWKQLSNTLSHAPESVLTILCLEVPFEKGKPKIPAHISKIKCFTHAQSKKWLHTIFPLSQLSLPKFIQAEAKRLNVRISSSIVSRLTYILPPDAALVSSELEKLALTADDSGLINKDALSLIEESLDSNIFEILRMVQIGKDTAIVWKKIQESVLSGESLIFAFLATLIREARILWQLQSGDQPSLPQQVISVKKVIANRLGFAGIAKLWDIALQADIGIKNGELSPEQTFEIVISKLYTVFQSDFFYLQK